eukprot:6274979-Pyramimonas_sp.AAC.1
MGIPQNLLAGRGPGDHRFPPGLLLRGTAVRGGQSAEGHRVEIDSQSQHSHPRGGASVVVQGSRSDHISLLELYLSLVPFLSLSEFVLHGSTPLSLEVWLSFRSTWIAMIR